ARLLENKLTERIAHDLAALGEGALSRNGRSSAAKTSEPDA
ncbi:MAG: phosphate acyltransferase, partial [Erythrobacter sp.]|nr:phosphate acyltransferase [Erythrobacter sp.]